MKYNNVKKTIIHLLSIIMAISAVVASSLLVSAQSAATVENNYARLMQLQANAVAANECLNESFGHDAIGNITFPDDFAGARIEEDKLVLSLTDTTAENKAKYIRWAGDYADYLLFENVEYSYNQLMNAAIDVTNTLKESGYQITQYYVSEINNEVVLGMDLNSELCQNGVSQINRPEALAASLSKEYNVPIRMENIAPSNTAASNSIATLRGGAKIVNITSNSEITLSCCGYYAGSDAILTCGHGGHYNDTINYAASAGSTIGTVNYHNYYSGCTGDFEIIKVTNTDTFSTSNSIANTYSINGTLSSPPVNTILKYYSRNSSSFGYGTVSNRDITVSAGTDKIEVNGLTSLEVSYGSCIPGDSGGPFFQETSSDVNYCGVLHGYGTDNPGYLRVYFTPYTYISGTGFSVRTR